MGANHDELSTRLKETTAKLDSLEAQQTEFMKLSQQLSQDIAKAKSTLAATQDQPKIKPPTLKTHSSTEITHWYREQLQSIIQAGKQHDKTSEATPGSSSTLSQ